MSPPCWSTSVLSTWQMNSVMVLRMVKMLSVVKPGTLAVISSGISASLDVPVPMSYSGWRIMYFGDGVVTLVADTVQVAILVVTCRRFNEPFAQLGVRMSTSTVVCFLPAPTVRCRPDQSVRRCRERVLVSLLSSGRCCPPWRRRCCRWRWRWYS